MNDEKEHFIPVSDSSPIFPDLTGTYAPFRFAIDWSDPHSQRFLSLVERIATALENKHGTPDVYMQDEYEVLVERDKVLQELVRKALSTQDAAMQHVFVTQMARQLGVFEEEKPTS